MERQSSTQGTAFGLFSSVWLLIPFLDVYPYGMDREDTKCMSIRALLFYHLQCNPSSMLGLIEWACLV